KFDVQGREIDYYQYANGADRMGIPIQYGALHRTYTLTSECKFEYNQGKIYWYSHGDIGGWHLYTSPIDSSEQENFKQYINLMEQSFDAKFVYGSEADILLETCKAQIGPKLTQKMTWLKQVYGSDKLFSNILNR
ncbi:MAG: hypothetical protein MRY83_12210, partial [Flavobacteriales bacterium]|nr:hypothetical protein [Flavobacteriales bacterium]